MNKGCGKPVEYTIPKGWSYKTYTYPCGRTGINGYPVLCDECQKKFNATEYIEDVHAHGERIDDDY